MRPLRAARVAAALLLAACAGGGPRPDFTLDLRQAYRGVRPQDTWFGILTNRCGCDTVMVKARGGRTLGPGASACHAAQWIGIPTIVRSWRDSTQLIEQWDYRGGACTLHLEGWSTLHLYVRRVRC
jgi:hypothetical protein